MYYIVCSLLVVSSMHATASMVCMMMCNVHRDNIPAVVVAVVVTTVVAPPAYGIL